MNRTALHHWHVRHGARLVESDAWLVPGVYSDVERETNAARTGLALADVSAFAKVSLSGLGVAALAADLTGSAAASKPRGVAALGGKGNILACRLADDHLLLLAGTTNPAVLDERLRQPNAGLGLVRDDAAMAQAAFWLVGPQGEQTLRQLTSLDVSVAGLPPGTCAETGLAGVPALLVRPPQEDLWAVGVHVSWDLAEYVWERLWETNRHIVPLGLEGLRALGLAAG